MCDYVCTGCLMLSWMFVGVICWELGKLTARAIYEWKKEVKK